MDTVEAEGSSIDEAIENALRVLQVERAKVEIEILSDATRGLFGLGGKKARVRATVRRPIDEPSTAPPELPAPPSRPATEPGVFQAEPKASPPTPTPPVRSAPPRAREAVPRPAPPVMPEPPRPTAAPLHPETAAQAQRLLLELVQQIGCTATVDAAQDGEQLLLTITSPNSNLLIGRHGQTLDAIEYMVNRMVARGDESGTRIAVDCEQYRVKRQRSLEQLARRLAERATKRGKPVSLDAMNPRDRRIIHLALQNEPGLTTRSSGTGYFRKLLIIPEGVRRRGRRSSDDEPGGSGETS